MNIKTSTEATRVGSVGTAHLVCGAMGSGKSTHARRIARERTAVRFATDEWMQDLFGPDRPNPMGWQWAAERAMRCEKKILETALQISRAGSDVVLELGLIRVADRERVAQWARAAGIALSIYWVETCAATRKARVLQRNTERGDTFSFEITPAMFDAIEGLYERPTEAELYSAERIDGERCSAL